MQLHMKNDSGSGSGQKHLAGGIGLQFSDGNDGTGIERVRVVVKSLKGVIAKARQVLDLSMITARSLSVEMHWVTKASATEEPGNLLIGRITDFETLEGEGDDDGASGLAGITAAIASMFEEKHYDTTSYEHGQHRNIDGQLLNHGLIVCPDSTTCTEWGIDRNGSCLRMVSKAI
jgi:hypothetical protein